MQYLTSVIPLSRSSDRVVQKTVPDTAQGACILTLALASCGEYQTFGPRRIDGLKRLILGDGKRLQ